MRKDGAPRYASLHRATKETDITVEWSLDGSGQGKIETSIRFFDHMLELLAKHGFFDLTVMAKGDIDIDDADILAGNQVFGCNYLLYRNIHSIFIRHQILRMKN